MENEITLDKKWILSERQRIIFELFDKGYRDADIARILFGTERSNICRFRQENTDAFKKWVLK